MVHGKPGQSATQILTISNQTASEIRFALTTEDVVVRDGKRFYSPAGQVGQWDCRECGGGSLCDRVEKLVKKDPFKSPLPSLPGPASAPW